MIWLFVVGLATMATLARAEVTVVVSPTGKDTAAGTLQAPLRTLGAAQAKVRALIAAGLKQPAKVVLRGGTYRLTAPLVLTPQDSGTAACPITWTSYAGEQAAIDGGRPITGWRQNGKLWETTIPEVAAGNWIFNELFVNGRRAQRARTPNEGFFNVAGTFDEKTPESRTSFLFKPGDIQQWDRLEDAVVVVFHSWETSLHHIKSLDLEKNIVTFTGPAVWHFRYFGPRRRFYVENVLEALDAPGEWYLNRATGVLSYMPLPGETISKTEFVAPVVSQLMNLQGQPDLGLPVEHLAFRNLAFRHADYVLKPEGHSDAQADWTVPGAISVTGGRNISFEGCELAHVGTYGIALRAGSKNCRIVRCHIYDAGAGLIRIGETGMTSNPELRCAGHVVDNNYLHGYGLVYAGACGLCLFQTSDNQLTHNEIQDGYYTGISIGWDWGQGETQAHNNLVEYNHVHHVVQGMMSDAGAIYTLGTSPGSIIRNNLFHDIFAYESPLIAWGIYLDAECNQYTVENNLAYNTTSGGLMMHNGGFGHTIRNNIFARGANQLIWRALPRGPSPTFERNICLVTQGDLFGYDGNPDVSPLWDRNLYWRTDGNDLAFMQDTFEDWQARGPDTHSLVADPQFVDLARDDFRLKQTSPAITQLGFKPFDTSTCGLYGDKVWTDLPKQKVWPPTVMPQSESVRKPTVINDGFENTPVGQPAEDAYTSEGPLPGGTILVSEEQAASGKRSLKFTDAPGLKNTWDPHMFYQPYQSKGTVRVRFKLWIGPKAEPWTEWRTAGYPYAVGPSLKVDAQDELSANNKPLMKLPREQWIAFEIVCKLGKEATGTYDLKVTLPGAAPQDFSGLACDPKFKQLAWLGFISLANEATVFYLDDVAVEPVRD